MFKKFIILEWKAFTRSASLGKSIGLKIFMGFIAVYFLVSFLALGLMLYPLIKELAPDKNVLSIVNSYVLLWLGAELLMRFFLQSLPVINMKPLMTTPIKRQTVIHYVLLKSITSFYNVLSLVVIVPFAIVYNYKENNSGIAITAWAVAMIALVLTVNYANFIIKKKFAENIKGLLPYLAVFVALALLEYFNVFKITAAAGTALDFIAPYPFLILLPFALLVGMYYWNFSYLRKHFYLDASLKEKASEVKTLNLNWTERFGEIAPFLKIDIKLILRNKRPRTTVFMSFIFLLYGLYFYLSDSMMERPAMLIFVGIFITGIFMINFGQFIPAWDSSYFSMMMSQNIPLKQYLASKAGLITFSIVVLAIFTTPYVYFGVNILLINLACALYNIGVNVPMILFAGAFNKKRIDLEKSPFMNYQGTGATQWIVIIPLMLIPMALWYGSYLLFNYEAALIILGMTGVVGIVLRGFLLNKIAAIYKGRKYGMISGFKEQES